MRFSVRLIAILAASAGFTSGIGSAVAYAELHKTPPPGFAAYTGPKGTLKGFEGAATCKGTQFDKQTNVTSYHGCGRIVGP